MLKNQCLLLQISQNSVKTPRFPTRRSRTKLYRPLVSNLGLKRLFIYKMSYFRFEIDLYYCICGFLVHFGTFWGILVKNPVNLGLLSLHFKLRRGNPQSSSPIMPSSPSSHLLSCWMFTSPSCPHTFSAVSPEEEVCNRQLSSLLL